LDLKNILLSDKFDLLDPEKWDYKNIGIAVYGKNAKYKSDKIIHMR